MATQGKEPGPAGKEKVVRGLSPSHPLQTTDVAQRKRSSSASARHHVNSTPSPSPSPSPSDRRVPNYLKPTISSGIEYPINSSSSIHGKNQAASATTSTQKPTLNRRRSFDKPPSPNSRLQKPHTSVNSTPTKNHHLLRSSSSSFIPKTSSSSSSNNNSLPKTQHQPMEKLKAPSPRDTGKSHSLSAKPMITSTTVKKIKSTDTSTVNKKQHDNTNYSTVVASPTASSTKARVITSISPDIDDGPLLECQHEVEDLNEYSLVLTDHVESNNADINSMVLGHQEDKEHVIQAEQEEDIKKQYYEEDLIKPNNCEPSTAVIDQHQSASDHHLEDHVQTEAETKGKVQAPIEETSSNNNNHQEAGEEHNEDESNKSEDQSTFPKIEEGEDKELGEVQGTANKNSKGKNSSSSLDDEKEDQVYEGIIHIQSKEIEEVEYVGTETKLKVENNMAAKQQLRGGQGKKKDSHSPVSNDVIEETASKLLEKRKNKVKALVGAFETVISLQEPET